MWGKKGYEEKRNRKKEQEKERRKETSPFLFVIITIQWLAG